MISVLSAAPCGAQEIELIGPIQGACIARLDRYSVPARLEWSSWLSGGLTLDMPRHNGVRSLPAVGLGAELTLGVLEYPGFPAAKRGSSERGDPEGNRAELRVGPWTSVERSAVGALVEGGLTAHLGTTDDSLNALVLLAPLGMADLRVGVGYGAFPDGRSAHVAIGVGWGYRVVFDRGSWGGACDETPPPALLADATLVRFVATVRRTTDFPATEVGLAIELSPTAALIGSRNRQRRHREQPTCDR